MARLIFLVLFLSSSWAFAQSITGTWHFTEIIYRGQRQPKPSDDLFLTWTFFENGTSRLYWDRGDKKIFCERFAHYSLNSNTLTEVTFSVNPLNATDCRKDPDMQENEKASTSISFYKNELWLHLDLSGEELIYILSKLE